FAAENRTSLCRTERDSCFLATGGTVGRGLYPFASDAAAGRPRRSLRFAALAAFRLVLEILVCEEVLFTRRPDELSAAVHAIQQPVLELHRPLPLTGYRD